MIKEGDTFPNNKVAVVGVEFKEIETDQLFSGKKVVLFAVPGAFTPTCNNSHLPSFIKKYDEIKGKGIDNIICLSVNDQFVSKVWRDSKSLKDDFLFIADGNTQVTESLGMILDCSGFGMGNRSNRYVMIIEDKVVKKLIVEDKSKKIISKKTSKSLILFSAKGTLSKAPGASSFLCIDFAISNSGEIITSIGRFSLLYNFENFGFK